MSKAALAKGAVIADKLIHIENVALHNLGTFARVKITRNEGGSLFGELV